jgi:hypothetical protein
MRHSVKRAFAGYAAKKQRLFDYKIDSVSIFFFLIAKRVGLVPRKSKRTQGLSILFHAENHLFHGGNSTNKINLCPVGWVRYVAHRPKDFVKIIVVVGPKPQMGRRVDVFAADERFLFV